MQLSLFLVFINHSIYRILVIAMKEKDIHVLSWEKFSRCTNSSGHANSKDLVPEDLIERLLVAMFLNQIWRRTEESHNGRRDLPI